MSALLYSYSRDATSSCDRFWCFSHIYILASTPLCKNNSTIVIRGETPGPEPKAQCVPPLHQLRMQCEHHRRPGPGLQRLKQAQLTDSSLNNSTWFKLFRSPLLRYDTSGCPCPGLELKLPGRKRAPAAGCRSSSVPSDS